MQNQIFKTKPVGRFGPIRLGADYMQDIERRAKLIDNALKRDRDKQLKLPFPR